MWLKLISVIGFVVILLPSLTFGTYNVNLQKLNGLHQCERINVVACQGLGYNMTVMPNLAGHTGLTEAELMISALRPILESDCSKHIKFLVCASMFPLCSLDVTRPIPACRSLCETVKNECTVDPLVSLIWPKFLDCDILPDPEKHGLCMQVPQEETGSTFSPTPPVGLWGTLKFSNLLNNNDNNSNKKTLPYNNGNNLYLITKTCPKNYTLSVNNDICVPRCNTDVIYTINQKLIIESWILILSAICFVLTLLSLVTFCVETKRFGFPERPVLFLTLCYNLLSICYLEHLIFHHSSTNNKSINNNFNHLFDEQLERINMSNDNNNMLSLNCHTTAPCLASYIITSYLMLSAASWWLIFSLCWYLSTAKQWSSEALENKSSLFHVLAWVAPLVPPICGVLFGGIKQHELTGLCISPGFTEVPIILLLVTGAILTILSAKSLHQLHITWQCGKLKQVMTRILLFGIIYFIPAMSAVLLTFVDNYNLDIKPCEMGDLCQPPSKQSSLPTLLRLLCILGGGALTGMWVWSKKTCNSCRSRIMSTPPTIASSNTPTTFTSINHLNKQTKNSGLYQKKLPKIYFNRQTPNPQAILYPGIHFQRA